jgi:uncharacterized protein (DUF305 family)
MPTMRPLLAALLFATMAGGPALAQDDNASAEAFPEVCKSDAGHAGHGGAEPMSEMPMAGMNEHQRAAMPGMMRMDRDMMQGMMQDDADVAFACGMIAHHQGAIDMARVELEHGDDEQMKQLAEKVIADQQREIAEMTQWLKENME